MNARYLWMVFVVPLAAGTARADEASAIAAIEKLNGEVERATNEPGMPVVMVRLHGPRVGDEALTELAAFPQLRAVYLSDAAVTDAGLKNIKSLKRLRELSLAGTKVTDTGLKELATLTELERLVLWDTQITDAGLEALSP